MARSLSRNVNSVLAAHWSNRPVIAVPRELAAYNYVIGRFLPRGTIVNDQRLRLNDWRSESRLAFERGAPGPQLSVDCGDYSGWSLRYDNSTRWGFMSGGQLGLDLAVSRTTNEALGMSGYHFSETKASVMVESGRAARTDAQYALMLIARVLKNCHAGAFVSQDFIQWSQESHREVMDAELKITHFDGVRSVPFEVTSTTVNLGLEHVTNGRMSSRVLLDDYADFYQTLLSHRQIRNSLRFAIIRPRASSSSRQRQLTLSGYHAIGIADHAEIAADWAYDHRTTKCEVDRLSSWKALLQTSVRLRLRSFAYAPDSGPGWETDTRADRDLGYRLRPGQFYAECRWNPPQLGRTSGSSIHFLSFAGMRNSHSYSLALSARMGVLRSVEMRLGWAGYRPMRRNWRKLPQ